MIEDNLRESFRKQRIVVLGGGFSRERDVSLRSAQRVYDALIRLGYSVEFKDPSHHFFDLKDRPLVFNMLHGRYGEDGSIQSFMEHLGILYTGSSVAASQLAMNKIKTKWILNYYGYPTSDFSVGVTDSVPVHSLSFPMVIKPIDEGSSVGVDVLDTESQLIDCITHHHELYGTYMLESFIDGVEITVGILESESRGQIELPVLELRPKNRFYDYEAKYTPGMTDFILPATLSDDVTAECQRIGYDVFKSMGCSGFGRVDMIVSPTKGPFILEVNTVPGMTETSDLPAQAKYLGMSYDELVDTILWTVYPKYRQLNS